MKPFYFDSIFFDYFTTGRVARLQNSLGLLIKKFFEFFNQDETIGFKNSRFLMSFDVDRFPILLVFFIIQTNLVC